jgi:hypothetical protein
MHGVVGQLICAAAGLSCMTCLLSHLGSVNSLAHSAVASSGSNYCAAQASRVLQAVSPHGSLLQVSLSSSPLSSHKKAVSGSCVFFAAMATAEAAVAAQQRPAATNTYDFTQHDLP